MYCRQCGNRVDGLVSLGLADGPAACPVCGCTSREFRKALSTSVTAGAGYSALTKHDGEERAFQESPRDNLAATGERQQDGLLSFTLEGTPRQGEADTLPACRILVDALNAAGANWSPPQKRQGGTECGVDCISVDRRDPKKTLFVQVVRADVRSRFWHLLAMRRKVGEQRITTGRILKRLKRAIEQKRKKIADRDRSELTLALDATRLPAYAFKSVVEEFHLKLGSWAGQLGFQSIWVVGPTVGLTRRLDVYE